MMQFQQQQQQDSSLLDLQIANPQQLPQDSVSEIRFSPQDQTVFACSTWDGKIYVYKIQAQQMGNQIQGNFQQVALFQYQEPIMAIAWRIDGQVIYGACGDFTVRSFNLFSNQIAQIGSHQAAIKAIFFEPNMNNSIITCSFDCSVCFWSEQTPNQPIMKIQIKGKIFAADEQFPILALGLQGEQIAFINLRQNLQMLNPNQINYTQSPLGQGSQLNCLKLFPKLNGFAIGSIDGRVHLGKIVQKGDQYVNENIMTFKCHKIEEKINNQTNQVLYPINNVCFNIRQDAFLSTSGSDGFIYFWDQEAKNKIKTLQFGKQPVSAVNISPNGQFMAYALGYDWHKGYEYVNEFQKPKICVHYIPDDELKFKK